MTAGYIKGTVGTDPIIDYTTVYSGGVIILNLSSSTPNGWNLTRYVNQNSVLVSGTVLTLPPPVPPLRGSAFTKEVFADAGEGSPLPLDPSLQYVYTFETSAGTISTPPLTTGCSIEIVQDDLTYLILKILKSAMTSLVIPANFRNTPSVTHAMPLTGTPRLPIITINQSFIGQSAVPIGQANMSNFLSNTNTTTAQADRIYSVAVLCSTVEEREFYRDAVIGVFNSILGPVLESLGQNTSHDFHADSGQVVKDDLQPGFYYSELMLKISGIYNVIVNSQFGVIKEIVADVTYDNVPYGNEGYQFQDTFTF